MNPRHFFAELKRRNVYKVAVAYVVVAWLLLQAASILFPTFDAPGWVMKVFVILLMLCFPIALILAWAFEVTPEGIKRESEVAPNESITANTGRRLVGATVILALVAAALLAFRLLEIKAGYPSGSPPRLVHAAASLAEKSIAVLPLVNTSGDPKNEYFSDGLSEELIAVLAKIPGLKIIGRSSSFLFKGKSDDSRTIGDKLGVVNLLEGSVRKQGDRVRIVAELINAADGRELWSDTYDRELKDVFAVQSEIAAAVTEQLKIKLFGATARSDSAPSNEDLAAYNALQQGTFYSRQSSEAGQRKAIEFYDEAIRLDPRYALAYAELSAAWRSLGATWLTGGEYNAESHAAYAKARRAAEAALSLAPDLAEAHEAMGFISLTPDLDFAAAAIHFRKAEELAPAAARPKNALTYLFTAEGRWTEAEEMARKALALDPLVMQPYLNLSRVLIARGRFDEAESILHKAVELQPTAGRLHTYLTTIDLLRGKPAAALQEAEQESSGFWRDYALTLAAQAQSDRAAAEAKLQDFIARYSKSGPFQIATIYGQRSEPDQMFLWLARAYTERDAGLTQFLVTPFLLKYQTDPRFAGLCQKLKVQFPLPVTKL